VATTRVDGTPIGIALDRGTHTLYVGDADVDSPDRISVVDALHCNGLDTSGCAQSWPSARANGAPFSLLVDPLTHRVFSANSDATVSVVDGADCNATDQSGCDRQPPRVPVGNTPLDLALDPSTRTVYVASPPDADASIIDARRPCAAPVRCERR
jgi:DNA-binding beta-propeller fold protein YncE